MKKTLLALCSYVLVIVFVFNLLPVQILATELRENAAQTALTSESIQTDTEVTVLEEQTDKRTEFSKEFLMSDGTRLAAIYATAVHYEKDGAFLEIDNSLISSGTGANAIYTNTAGPWQVTFPQRLTGDNRVTVTKDGYTLSFGMAGQLHSSGEITLPPIGEETQIMSQTPAAEEAPPAEAETEPPAAETTEPPTEAAAEPSSAEVIVEAVTEPPSTADSVPAEAEAPTANPVEDDAAPAEAAQPEAAETVPLETEPPAAETAEPPTEAVTEPPTEAATEPPAETASQAAAESSAVIVPEFTITAATASVGQIQSSDVTALREQMQHPELVPDHIHSRLSYANVYGTTDIAYDLNANRVKESIIINDYDPTLQGYSYFLETEGLTPVLQENSRIHFMAPDGETVVMVMPAPYMVDANNEYSDDIQVTLTPYQGGYKLNYLLINDWLADEDRAFPVILDPVIQPDMDIDNIHDQTVFQNRTYDYEWGILECGYDVDWAIERFFLKYENLPALTSADVIVDAQVNLYLAASSDNSCPVEVHKVNGTWASDTVTWSNAPGYDTTVEDFEIVQAEGWYTWNVTDIARKWYTGDNTGMIFKASDAVESAAERNWKQFYSCNYSDALAPSLIIQFRNNNGLESYWDYTASSAGRAGTGYINDYTGNLVWVRDDIGFGGNRMPVTISHIYNANDSLNNAFGIGYGWRLNLNQRVYQWSEDSNYYVWEDSDGTKHYFYYVSSGTYEDEDGLELTLTTTGSGNETYTITDKYGNKSFFDSSGRLTRQQNNQQTVSSISIAYSSGNQISTVTDGAGRVYGFTYSGGLLTRISFKGKGSTELSYVSFGYSGSQLTSITDKDGETCYYGYTSNNLLSSVQDIDGYKLNYTYNTLTAGQPNRVAAVMEYDGSVLGGALTIEYAQNQTSFTDHNGNKQILQFNNWGNTVSIQDGLGRAQFAQYATDTSSTGKGNQLTAASKLQNTVGNILIDHNFENGRVWTGTDGASTSISGTAYYGSRSLQVSGTGAAESPQTTIPSKNTYTFSAYVKVTQGSAKLGLYDATYSSYGGYSETITASDGWTRLEVSYTNPGTTTHNLTARVIVTGGSAIVDCVQLEAAPTASRYNLIENGDFRHTSSSQIAYGWTTWGENFTADDKLVTASASAAPQLDNKVYQTAGCHTTMKHLYQIVRIPGSAGDTYILGGWAKGDSVAVRDSRCFSIVAVFYNTDGTVTERVMDFNPDADSSVNWQYAAIAAIADKNYNYILIDIRYDYNANTAYFDGIQLYKEEFGNSYTYDADGNVTAVKDIQAQTTTYEYVNNNLTAQTLPTGAKLTYTYDDHHNVKTATTDTGIVYNFGYDAYGNNTSVSIGSGITSRASYTTDGNRLATTTDAAGKITKYSYDENTNVLNWVQYPNDSENTRTNYTYDSMYRLATASASVGGLSSGTALTASYTYEDDLLTKIQTGSTTYSFSYGNFAMRSAIQIGSRTLASYSYTDRNNYLSSLDYGNGDKVQYTYDNYGRVTGQTYEDGDTVSYTYDNSGALATVTDSATGIRTTYYYDFTDRLMKYVESSGDTTHSVQYGYDDINNLTSMVETINGTAHTTSYAYDDDNRLTTVSNGSVSKTYGYDSYSRVSSRTTKYGTSTVLTDTLTYIIPMSNVGTTGQVGSLRSQAAGYDVTYTYNYDDNGNILYISDGTNTTLYAYDSANQLIRENNQAAGKTWVWTYDDGGNITSRTEYPYSTGGLGTAVNTVSYTYGDSSWGDLLTGYNGQTITSDTIGNMLSDGTWTYTWEHGRELASMSDGTTTWTYTYNADGMRTSRSNGTTAYSYVYNGSSLSQMTVGTDTLYFTYDASTPMSVTYNGATYYYVTNLQGDVTAILNSAGAPVVTYTYDAWGNPLSTSGTMADTLGTLNPLRYRSYVYDIETGLYYLQSRYYDPELGRFINADAFTSTGQGFVGNNMFAYCNNDPVGYLDSTGNLPIRNTMLMTNDGGGMKPMDGYVPRERSVYETIREDLWNLNITNTDAEKTYSANHFSIYKGALVFRHYSEFLTSWSIGGVIFLNKHKQDKTTPAQKEQTLNHEYGHVLQWRCMGALKYVAAVFIPSATYNYISRDSKVLDDNYYNMPWERDADRRGGINRGYASWADPIADLYFRIWG